MRYPCEGQLCRLHPPGGDHRFAVVEVETNVGITGISVTYHEVGGEAIREFIRHAIKPKFIGRNPFETEALYKETFHYMRGVGRKGLAFCAYSAVDIALWDIKGKVLNMPLFRLLGGNDPVVPIYASGGWTSYSIEELVDEAKMMVARGYKKIKLKVGVDGGRNPMEDVRRVAAVREQSVPTSLHAGRQQRLESRYRHPICQQHPRL